VRGHAISKRSASVSRALPGNAASRRRTLLVMLDELSQPGTDFALVREVDRSPQVHCAVPTDHFCTFFPNET